MKWDEVVAFILIGIQITLFVLLIITEVENYKNDKTYKAKRYRPYKNTKEMIKDYKKRFKKNISPYEMPLIWLKSKDDTKNEAFVIVNYMPECVIYNCFSPTTDSEYVLSDMKDLFSECVYLNNSLCGMEIK